MLEHGELEIGAKRSFGWIEAKEDLALPPPRHHGLAEGGDCLNSLRMTNSLPFLSVFAMAIRVGALGAQGSGNQGP